MESSVKEPTVETVEPVRARSLTDRVAEELKLSAEADGDRPGGQDMSLGSATYTKMLARRHT